MDSNYNLLHMCSAVCGPQEGCILTHSDLGEEPLLYVEGEPNCIWALGEDILLHIGSRMRHPAACVRWGGAPCCMRVLGRGTLLHVCSGEGHPAA